MSDIDAQLARLFPVRGGAWCPQGHPFDAENTKFTALGHRYCAACKRQKQHDRYHQARGHQVQPSDGSYRYLTYRRWKALQGKTDDCESARGAAPSCGGRAELDGLHPQGPGRG